MQLFPYQIDALNAIKAFNGKALLALDMGLGKTIVALAAIDHYREWPVVVVCPACMVWQWRKEAIEHSSLSAEDIYVITGKDFPATGVRMYVTSYERATRYALELSICKPGLVVLDESHYIKNHKAKRTKQLVPLCQETGRVLLLTGTPVLNRPIELWSQLEALNVSLGKYHQFGVKYCNGHVKNVARSRMAWDFSGASNVAELSQVLRSSCMIRKTKAEIAHQLPEKRRTKTVIEGLARPSSIAEIENEILQSLYITGSPAAAWALLKENPNEVQKNMFTAYRETAELKAVAAAEICCCLAGSSPLVVFAHHKIVVDTIAARLQAAEISGVRITGSESPEEKQKAVEMFQAGEVRVAVCSLKAASTGITLTRASDMVIAEMPFSPGDALQAENRIHRIGQKNGVLIRYLVAKETLDDVLFGMIRSKDALVSRLIDNVCGSQFAGLETETVGGYWEAFKLIFDNCVEKWRKNGS